MGVVSRVGIREISFHEKDQSSLARIKFDEHCRIKTTPIYNTVKPVYNNHLCALKNWSQ